MMVIKMNKKNDSEYVRVMIGSGKDAIFVYKKRGEKYMLPDGTIVIAGDNLKHQKERYESKIDTPVAFVRKLIRIIGNR